MRKSFNKIISITIAIFIAIFLRKQLTPEIQEAFRIESPTKEWVAIVQTTIYGDHWFVNDARLEVRIANGKSNKDDATIYSTDAHASDELSIKWLNNDTILIKDGVEYLHKYPSEPYLKFKVQHQPNTKQ